MSADLKAQRARAAATTAAYWPRTSTNAEFIASLAAERAKRERELSTPVACGAQRSVFDLLNGITDAAARIERAKAEA
jgi:hypothetical protein